ncbi:MAG: RNA methyltransferase [Desulfobacterales bacterium]|nr:RNA methyltransferase [Desulfobacterales bacterium]
MSVLENISIVLTRPKYSENIGAAARAMKNMGFSKLIVVSPQNYDFDNANKVATHESVDILNKAEFTDSLKEALLNFNYIIGTTARLGKNRQGVYNPSEMAEKLRSISKKNLAAIVFGPEDKGLQNDDLQLCDAIINIPTSSHLSSINLAQSVMIICYELFKTSQETIEKPIPQLARRYELEGMYSQLKEILIKINYIRPDNPDYWLNNFRHFFNRFCLYSREVYIIRGLCRQIEWYGNKRYNDALKERNEAEK